MPAAADLPPRRSRSHLGAVRARRHRNEVHFDEDAFEELKVSLHTTEVDPVPIDGDTIILDTTDFESIDNGLC